LRRDKKMNNKKLAIISLLFATAIISSALVFAEENVTPSILTKEQVKCVFDNSNEAQKCYTDDYKFGCSGTGTCVTDISGETGYKLTWKSSCDGYSYTIIDGVDEYAEFKCASTSPESPITVQEQVKCVFDNSNEIQKCYTDDYKFSCSGTGTCVVDVSGDKGKKLTWKSSCDGYGYTIMDGDSEYAEFKCVSKTNPTPIGTPVVTTPVIIKEQVKCVFKNAATPQKCYTAEDSPQFYCSEGGTCLVDVTGNKGEKLTWKSSCGGYAYTITDGENEYVEFNCVSEGNTTTEKISGKGFRYAYWQCYNGEEQKQGSESSCKSSETWQSYAKEFCQDKCYEDESKCGANSFGVTQECYLDSSKENFIPTPTTKRGTNESREDILICKDSCPLDGKCYPFGYRKSGEFCSDSGSFVEQLKEETVCDNNFECSSNVCVSGTCISEGFLQKIIDWFKNLFG